MEEQQALLIKFELIIALAIQNILITHSFPLEIFLQLLLLLTQLLLFQLEPQYMSNGMLLQLQDSLSQVTFLTWMMENMEYLHLYTLE
jgi:hypothetical protein